MKQKCTVRHIWGIIYPALTYLAIMYLVQILVIVLASIMVGGKFSAEIKGMTESQLLILVNNLVMEQMLFITAISAFVGVPIGLLFMYFDRQKEKEWGVFKKYKGRNPLTFLLIIPLGITAMLAGNYFVGMVQMFLPTEWVQVYDSTAEILYSGGLGVQILATVIGAPIVEEIIFRGVIYKRIKWVSNSTVAIFLSALFFGVFHMNVVQGIYAFILGAVLAYVYEKYKSIIAPILLHLVANLTSVLITYAASGMEAEQASQEIAYSQTQLISSYTIMIAVTGAITIGLLLAINKTVKLREAE